MQSFGMGQAINQALREEMQRDEKRRTART